MNKKFSSNVVGREKTADAYDFNDVNPSFRISKNITTNDRSVQGPLYKVKKISSAGCRKDRPNNLFYSEKFDVSAFFDQNQ
jgi:hypothetical protein